MAEFNPYAVPEASIAAGALVPEADEGVGVWRDGSILVMSKFATLPGRCLKCNAPATSRLRRKFRWHHPGFYFLLLFYFLWFFLLIGYFFVVWRATVQLPICSAHRSRRFRGILIGLGVWMIGLATLILPMLLEEDYVLIQLFGAIIGILGLVWTIGQWRWVGARKIDRTHVWIKRVCPAYLDELPEVPRLATLEVV